LRAWPVVVAAVMAITAGCAAQPKPAPSTTQDSSRITVDDKTHTVQSVQCDQVQWLVSLQAAAGPTHVTAMLQLDGETPTVKTVNIENFDGFYGVSGQGVDDTRAEATFTDGTYTITGTARGSNSADPGHPRTATFQIQARCGRVSSG
jgi:ipoprotein LpqH